MPELRDYQEDLLLRVESALDADASARVMMQLPTGGGKTVIAGELLKRRLTSGRKAVWLTHRRELANQTFGMVRDAGVNADVFLSGNWSTGTHAPALSNGVVVLMALTVGNRAKKMEVWNSYDENDLLVIDEAHHASADSWERAMKQWPGQVVGMTATPWRLSEKEGFDHLFEELIPGPQVADLQDVGWLCRAKVLMPPLDQRILGGKVGSIGDYTEPGIKRANYGRGVMTAGALSFWQEKAQGRQTIVYAVSKKHAHNLVALFRDAGIPAEVILGDTAPGERARAIDAFKAGGLTVLVNVAVATEGFDLPDASCVVITRPTKSLALFMQMIGRGLRRKEDGGSCLILDLTDTNSVTHGLPEKCREWKLAPRGKPSSGEAPVDWCEGCGAVCHPSHQNCPDCGWPFGEECARCGSFRRWKRWLFKNHCDDAHELVCDHCHNDAHIRAQLPPLIELADLEELPIGIGFERDYLGAAARLLWQIEMESVPVADISDWIHETGDYQGRPRNRRRSSVEDLRTVVLWHRWLIVAMNAVINGRQDLSRWHCWRDTDLTMRGLHVKPRGGPVEPWRWRVSINDLAEALDELKADPQAYESLQARIKRDTTMATAMVAERKAQKSKQRAEEATKVASMWRRDSSEGSKWAIDATRKERRANRRAKAWKRRAAAYREAANSVLAASGSESVRLTEDHYKILWEIECEDRVLIHGQASIGKAAFVLELALRSYQIGNRVAVFCQPGDTADWMGEQTRSLPPIEVLVAATNARNVRAFDYLIVDRAQYFDSKADLEMMDSLLAGGLAKGRWAMLADLQSDASIYRHNLKELEPFCPSWQYRDLRLHAVPVQA